MAKRVVLRQQIIPPSTVACLGCKLQVLYELTHCPDCGRSMMMAKQLVMNELVMERVPSLPVTSEEGVRRLLLAMFGPWKFQRRFEENSLPSLETVAEVVASLRCRDAEIIKRRYGMDGQKPWTLAELAALFNISLDRVRQLQERSLHMLRHSSRVR